MIFCRNPFLVLEESSIPVRVLGLEHLDYVILTGTYLELHNRSHRSRRYSGIENPDKHHSDSPRARLSRSHLKQNINVINIFDIIYIYLHAKMYYYSNFESMEFNQNERKYNVFKILTAKPTGNRHIVFLHINYKSNLRIVLKNTKS